MIVLVADDHPLVRDALAHTLRRLLPQAQVLEAASADDAERLLQQHAVALALLDLHMPGMAGVQGLRALHQRYPALPLVVVSGDEDPEVMRGCAAAGALAFLPKSEPAEVLQQALQVVLAGGSYLPRQALAGWAAPGEPPPAPPGPMLTPRQLAVLRGLMRGLPNKLIARELGLTEGTVKIHVAAVLRALQARNRTEAVVRASAAGITP